MKNSSCENTLNRQRSEVKHFPQGIKFKYEWRRYQKKVLDDLEGYLDDNHLHIIAPPGSGKTVLGLEVAIRLNKPTLILAPTVAIRNQWVQRFCELFLQVREMPNWISCDIRNPEFLTVVTYQALHAASTNTFIDEDSDSAEEEEGEAQETVKAVKEIDTAEVVAALKDVGAEVIIVDEAHHLKNEWWRSLNAVKSALNATVVGLTATPPYDVSFAEWQRYVELNGSVDAEISVPELVVENDLCPHQDYVFLSEPTETERAFIREQRTKALNVFEELKRDETLIRAVTNHPIFRYPLKNLEWIYGNLEYYSAVLIFLYAAGKTVTDKHLEVIGDKKFKVPSLTYEWIEKLLTFYLFVDKENFSEFEEHKEKLVNKLKKNGLLERKTVSFRSSQRVNTSLGASLSKLQSIDKIVDIEYDKLGSNLRMVILTDFIRKEFLTSDSENSLVLNKIGVIPIFEQLRRTNHKKMKLGILSGSFVLIPLSAESAMQAAAQKYNIDGLSFSALPYDSSYLVVNISEKLKHNIVQIVTNIFEKGEIEVLIGTKSLLGEGWDAPAINSLILASFVGSFVLSNQMRGRAIRSTRNNPDKTGNIWHLVCVDTTSRDGGDDIQLLRRRFKSFVGVNKADDAAIENGINRLCLPDNFTKANIERFNSYEIVLAEQRDLLRKRWSDALVNGVTLAEEIRVPFPDEKDYKQVKSLYYNKTIASLLASLVSSLLIFLQMILEGLAKAGRSIRSYDDLLRVLAVIGIVGVAFFGRQFYKTLRVYVKYRDISKDIQQIGESLLASLVKAGTIQTEYSKLFVKSSADSFGAIYCHLEGGTTFEKSTFIKSLHEILGCIGNPKYLIIRKSLFLNVLSQKDYHSVPETIGQNKKMAEYFESQWKRFVGSCELVYTRTVEGRKMLLKSRISSLSSEFEDKVERINRWR